MPLKILMVCLGNICRSPMAHGLLQYKAELSRLDWEVDSAGTYDGHRGALPDNRSIICMKHHGIDITYQRSRPIIYEDIEEFDLIYVMDRNNYSDVINMTRSEEEMQKVKLVMSEVYPDVETDVPDPYYGGDTGFEKVYKMLDRATDKIIEKYSAKSGK